MFSIQDLSSERQKSIEQTIEWTTECPVPLKRLRSVHFDHYDFKNQIVRGEMIVLDVVAENVLHLFEELLERKFPIQSCLPSDEFKGDDVLCMDANNSSAFNCRKVMNTDRWSSHAYGLALDINPRQNPYVLINHQENTAKIYPTGGSEYLNRHISQIGMVEPVVDLFAKYGFTEWGGAWKSPLDYHHFQLPWTEIHRLMP